MRARALSAVTIALAIVAYSDLSSQATDAGFWPHTGEDSRHAEHGGNCGRDGDPSGNRERRDERGGRNDQDARREHHNDDERCGGRAAGTGTISGTVTGDNGAMAGWSVYLIPQSGNVTAAKTDANGAYSFSNLQAGTYMVCEANPAPTPQELPAAGSAPTSAPCSVPFAPFGFSVPLTTGGSVTGNTFFNGFGGVG